jgi:hypothetical protein
MDCKALCFTRDKQVAQVERLSLSRALPFIILHFAGSARVPRHALRSSQVMRPCRPSPDTAATQFYAPRHRGGHLLLLGAGAGCPTRVPVRVGPSSGAAEIVDGCAHAPGRHNRASAS